MARVIVEDAVLATGRSPETIERWILAGRVDAERAGDEWLIDLSSLLNVAAAEDAHGNGNGHGHKDIKSPIDSPADEFGGRLGPIAGAAQASVVASARVDRASAGLPDGAAAASSAVASGASPAPLTATAPSASAASAEARPSAAPAASAEDICGASPARSAEDMSGASPGTLPTASVSASFAGGDDGPAGAGSSTDGATAGTRVPDEMSAVDATIESEASPNPSTVLATARDAANYGVIANATVEVATTAIGALSARLEQAISEIERLQDERMKLAMQLGFTQAQLKSTTEQLRALSAPPEPPSLRSWLTRLFRRD